MHQRRCFQSGVTQRHTRPRDAGDGLTWTWRRLPSGRWGYQRPRPVARALPARCDDTGPDVRPRQGASRDGSHGQGAVRERCDRAPAAPGSRPTGSQTVSPLLVLRTGACTATPPLVGALLSTPRTELGTSSVRCASAFFEATQEESPLGVVADALICLFFISREFL